MVQKIHLGPVESGQGVSTMRHTLQCKHSARFDFLSLQTYDNWRLRWDCQERDKNKHRLDEEDSYREMNGEGNWTEGM